MRKSLIALNGVAAGIATGVAFVILFAIFPIATYPGYRDNFTSVDPGHYPFLQLHISGLRETYAAGETINFQVTQSAGGCAYPDYIAIKNLKSGSAIFEFNGTEASALLFCPVIFNPADTSMRWSSEDWTESSIVAHEAGSYAVVVEHLYMKVQQPFKVVAGMEYVSVISMPVGFRDYDSVSFNPHDVNVVIGLNNTVRWTNNDVYANWIEPLTNGDNLFGSNGESKILQPGYSFEIEFDEPGKYAFLGNDSRQGTITVLQETE